MYFYDLALAAVLLTAPSDVPVPTVSPEDYARLRPAVQQIAQLLEIVDERELSFMLLRVEDFEREVHELRRRHEICRDAPPLADSYRFPDRAFVSELLSFNRSYRQHLDACLTAETVRWWEMHEAIQETDRLYHVWDTVRDTRCEYYYVSARREALKRLRDMVGPEAYYSGCLPPHVPVWRFQRID